MFEDFAAVQTGRTVVRQEDGTVDQVRFASVSPNFLAMLGATVVIGRTTVRPVWTAAKFSNMAVAPRRKHPASPQCACSVDEVQ